MTTLFDRLWQAHIVRDLGDGWALLHVDRHLLHDLSGPSAINDVGQRGLTVRSPELTYAVADHLVSSAADRTSHTNPTGGAMWDALDRPARRAGIRVFGIDSREQGIVHVAGPEQGIVLPGLSVVCADSHTCTNGALGALAFGIGSTECSQTLATQVLVESKPLQMRVVISGELGSHVTAKDIALALITELGASAGVGYAVEFAGPVVDALDMEARLTLCNLTVELGAKFGVIAPDRTTVEWIAGRPFAPTGTKWDDAVAAWNELRSDADAAFDREVVFDVDALAPQVTWGTSPEQAVPIDGEVPLTAASATLEYMGLRAGMPLVGLPIDWVFIGSCANSRLSDLRAAAAVAKGRRVAPGVTAWVVPGSETVRVAAESEGLDRVFTDAGFDWRRPGCSMCVAANGERVPSGARCVSTSNRNFIGRQGPGARTHLASPATAAAAAVTGWLVDVREMGAP